MSSLRRTFRVAHAWLMALLTLAGGLPHRQCVCPDGAVKWFCLDPSDDACRDCDCCTAGRDEEAPASAAARPCCRHSSRSLAPGRVLRQTPCRKTWVPSSVVVDKPTRETGPAKDAQGPALLAAIPAGTGAIPDGLCQSGRPANRAPPLPDRILLLQRLLL